MHDQNFKNLIIDYPRESLSFFAASESRAIETARFTPIRQEQLKERLSDPSRELDTPLLVEWPNGEREALLFVIEEESITRRFSIYRLARYCLDIAEMLSVNRVVPVVIFLHGGKRKERLTLGSETTHYLDFHYLHLTLNALKARDYLDSDNVVVRVNLPNMRYRRNERLKVYAAAQAGLALLESDTNRRLKYAEYIDYYADLDQTEIETYRNTYLTTEVNAMGLAQILRQEGEKEGERKGREQGREEGRQQGEAAILTRQLEFRFGSLDEVNRQRIKQADTDTLLTWSERVLTAESLEAVFRVQDDS